MRDAEDLLTNPEELRQSSAPPVPIAVVLDNLTTVDGRKLEILTRTNPNLASAAQIGFIFRTMFNSDYVAKRVELIERLAVSMDGKGREEQISALQAGGKLPDSYFEGETSDVTEAR